MWRASFLEGSVFDIDEIVWVDMMFPWLSCKGVFEAAEKEGEGEPIAQSDHDGWMPMSRPVVLAGRNK